MSNSVGENGKLVSVRNVAVGFVTGTVVAGVIIWIQSELKCKADISMVQRVENVQMEYNRELKEIRERELKDIRERLVRIETIVREK